MSETTKPGCWGKTWRFLRNATIATLIFLAGFFVGVAVGKAPTETASTQSVASVVGVVSTSTATLPPDHTATITESSQPADTPAITQTPLPTSTPLPPTVTPLPIDTPLPTNTAEPEPTATSVAVTFESDGLGLDKATFDATHTETGSDLMGTIYDYSLIVAFLDNRVWYIEQQFSDGTSVEIIESQSITLIPADSVLVEIYNPDGRPETTVHLYMSESLKNYFDTWTGGEPGNFTVQYNMYEGKVTRMIIAIGNNP